MIKTKAFQNFVFFCLFLIFLCLAFWPAISSNYVYHDDALFFLKTPTRLEAPGAFTNLRNGRFIGSHLYIGIGFLINSVNDLKSVRLLGVMIIALCAFLFFLWLRKKSFSNINSFLISLSAFTLPSFQVAASQTAMTYQPLAILFAVGAFFAAYRISVSGKIVSRILNRWFALSGFLFFCGLITYKPTIMFYWTMAGCIVLFARNENIPEIKDRLINLSLPTFASMGIYAFVLQLIKPLFPRPELLGYNSYNVSFDFVGKIIWFFKEPFFNSLNLWNIFPSKIFAILFLLLVFSAAILKILRKEKAQRSTLVKKGAVLCLFLGALVFLSFLPNMIYSGNISYYRCTGPLAVLIFLVFIWSSKVWIDFISRNNKNIFTGFLVVVSIFGIILAHQTILKYRALPSQKEFEFVLSQIQRADINQYRRIYFIRPEEKNLKKRGDEFGSLTTVYGHDIIGLVSCVLREIAKGQIEILHIRIHHKTKTVLFIFRAVQDKAKRMKYEIMIDSGTISEMPKHFSEKTLVIDMRKFENNIN